MTPRRMALSAAVAFLVLVVAANLLTSTVGMVPVGFGLVATAGTYAAGATLIVRDVLHELGGRRAVLACIVIGSAQSALLSPRLALASGVAFLLSELADLAVYDPLRRRGRLVASAVSNVVGAAVDSLLFLWLAGFPVGAALPGQVVAKVSLTLAVLVPAGVGRALLRHRVRAPRS